MKSGCLIYKNLSILRNKQNHEKMCLLAFVTFSDTNQSALLSSIARAWKQDLATARIHMSRVVRKPAFCICENKDADQLRGNREADQRLCFRYTDTTIPLLSKSEISSF